MSYIPKKTVNVDGNDYEYMYDTYTGDEIGEWASVYYSPYAEGIVFLSADTGEEISTPISIYDDVMEEVIRAYRDTHVMTRDDYEDRNYHWEKEQK